MEESKRIGRNSAKSKLWKKLVLEKDNFKCTSCDSITALCAHHIKEWDDYPELRYDINNGITLCRKCHMSHHKNKKGVKHRKAAWNKGLKGVSKGMPKGTKFTEEHKAKLSAMKRGTMTWNKGLKGELSHMTGRQMPHRGKSWIVDPISGKRKYID